MSTPISLATSASGAATLVWAPSWLVPTVPMASPPAACTASTIAAAISRRIPGTVPGRGTRAPSAPAVTRAAALRDQEKQLLADKLRLERQLTAGVDVQTVIAENQRAHREIERLRELLRRHGIEPNGGDARTA